MVDARDCARATSPRKSASTAPHSITTFVRNAIIEAQFADVLHYRSASPDILAVYRELVARAPRDPAVRAPVERLHDGWRVGIVGALRSGQGDGTFRRDIDPEAAARLILSTVWGLVAQSSHRPRLSARQHGN